jgi:hypothetical protein
MDKIPMQEKPLTFEEWRGSLAPTMSDEMMKSIERLHNIDSKKEFDDMLKREYNEYLDNFNGNWLLR